MDLSIHVLEWGQRNSMTENEKQVFIDGNGKEVTISSDDFKLVQSDSKIHDVKFARKPTTFFKDAMRRFAHSKSAVTGGVIVGLLVLGAIIIPLCTPDTGVYNTNPSTGGGTTQEVDLPPKLFPAGTGFWDGTLKRSDVTYDTVNKVPVGDKYYEGTYFNLTTSETTKEAYSEYGRGGYVNVNANGTTDATFYSGSFDMEFVSSVNVEFAISDEMYATYDFTGYKFAIYDGYTRYYLVGDENTWSKETKVSLDVSSVIDELYLENARFEFTVKKSEDSSKIGSMLISSFSAKTDSIDEEFVSNLEEVSFKDGNTVMQRTGNGVGVWNVTGGARSAHAVEFTVCSFTYDPYAYVYGEKDKTFSARELLTYVNSGALTVNLSSSDCDATTDAAVLAKRFVVNQDSDCPIAEVVEQVGNATYDSSKKQWTGYTLKVKVYNYKLLGYSKAPSFIFGTNDTAKDYCKLMFTGMRLSFLIAIGVSFVNIIIGLIWGSISGYFGGWVDIIMERICDIISGLPSTVIITLCILYGREFNWGSAADVIALMVALFMTGWMGVSARTRTQFYRYKGREYVLASRTLGAKDGRLIFRHILPNASGTIITGSILMIPNVIYTEASIAYLGLGLQGQVLFGVILSEANSYYQGDKAFLLYIPTFVMMLLLVSFNLFGNGLRDAFNPALKGGKN